MVQYCVLCGNVEGVDGVSVHWYLSLYMYNTITTLDIIITKTIFIINNNMMIILVSQRMLNGGVNG